MQPQGSKQQKCTRGSHRSDPELCRHLQAAKGSELHCTIKPETLNPNRSDGDSPRPQAASATSTLQVTWKSFGRDMSSIEGQMSVGPVDLAKSPKTPKILVASGPAPISWAATAQTRTKSKPCSGFDV